VNLQHDCFQANCQAIGQEGVRQEQEITGKTRSIMVHADKDCFVVNTHALYNMKYIHAALPPRLLPSILFLDDIKRQVQQDAAAEIRHKKGAQTEAMKELVISAIEAHAGDVSDRSAAHSETVATSTTILERLQDDEDFVETLQGLFGDALVSETIVLAGPIPESQGTAPAGPSTNTLPCDAPVGPQKAKGKKKVVQSSPEPM